MTNRSISNRRDTIPVKQCYNDSGGFQAYERKPFYPFETIFVFIKFRLTEYIDHEYRCRLLEMPFLFDHGNL